MHYKSEYSDLGTALNSGKADALAVVGVMLTKQNRSASGLEKVKRRLSSDGVTLDY